MTKLNQENNMNTDNNMPERSYINGLSRVTWAYDKEARAKLEAKKATLKKVEPTVEGYKERALNLCDHIERRMTYTKDLLLREDMFAGLTFEEAKKTSLPLYDTMYQCDNMIDSLREIGGYEVELTEDGVLSTFKKRDKEEKEITT